MSFLYFVDARGRKAAAGWTFLADPADLAYLLEQHPHDAVVAHAVAQVRNAPLISRDALARAYRLPAGVAAAHAVLLPSVYQNSLRSSMLGVAYAQWARGAPSLALVDALNVLRGKNVRFPALPHVRRVVQQLGSNTVVAAAFSKTQDFAHSQSLALFGRLANGTEGYLDKNGVLGPLSKAHTYDTEAEMQHALQHQRIFEGWSQLQVVRLNTQVAALGAIVVPKAGGLAHTHVGWEGSSIYAVAAHVLRGAMEDALTPPCVAQTPSKRARKM